jgi:hypothetical protein
MRFVESNSVYNDLCSSSGLCGRQALPLHTKLFEGDHPIRASAVLGHVDHGRFMSPLNHSPAKVLNDYSSSKNISLQKGGVHITSSFHEKEPRDLHKQLEVLLLSPQQMTAEDYPSPKVMDITSNSSNHDLISDLQKISESLHLIIDSSTVSSSDTPIMESSAALPFKPERAKEIAAILETYLLKDGEQLSPFVEPLYLSTFLSRQDNAIPKIYAMDCEMVKTTYGSEIARVTLIRLDQQKSHKSDTCHYTTVLDMLVQPPNQIVDFVTGKYDEGC